MSLGTAQHPIHRLPQQLPRKPVQCPTAMPVGMMVTSQNSVLFFKALIPMSILRPKLNGQFVSPLFANYKITCGTMYKRLAYLQHLLLEQLLLPLLPMILITLNLRVVGTSLQEIRMSLGTAQHPIYRLPQ